MAPSLLKHPVMLLFARLAGLAIVLNLLSVSVVSAHLTSSDARATGSLSVGATVLPSCEITSGELASELFDDAPVTLDCWNLNPLVETAPESRITVDGKTHRVVITTINF